MSNIFKYSDKFLPDFIYAPLQLIDYQTAPSYLLIPAILKMIFFPSTLMMTFATMPMSDLMLLTNLMINALMSNLTLVTLCGPVLVSGHTKIMTFGVLHRVCPDLHLGTKLIY